MNPSNDTLRQRFGESIDERNARIIGDLHRLLCLDVQPMARRLEHVAQIKASNGDGYYRDMIRDIFGPGSWVDYELSIPAVYAFAYRMVMEMGLTETRATMALAPFGGDNDIPGPVHRLFIMHISAIKCAKTGHLFRGDACEACGRELDPERGHVAPVCDDECARHLNQDS